MSVSIGARPARAKAMVVSSEARPARAKAMVVSSEARPARAKVMAVSTPRTDEREKATGVSRERFPMHAGYGGAWPGTESTHRATHQRPGATVWRAPEGPEGTGGLRDRPLRAAGSRVAISRAAGPDGARNTSGAASNKLNRKFRLHRRCEGRKRAWLRRPEQQRSRKQQAQSQIPAAPPV